MSGRISVQTSRPVVPMIYAYTTPEIKKHDGWTKIGYTEQDVTERIMQQTHTADVEAHEEWRGTAIFDDGSGETFKDKDFHRYLLKKGVKQDEKKNNEWFHINGPDSYGMFTEFKSNRGIVDVDSVNPYVLRKEQEKAVKAAIDYFELHEKGEFLWNAKPRFGKTLSSYDLVTHLDAKRVLIVTNRPAIANSWYEDYCRFIGDAAGYRFVSETSSLKGRSHVIAWDDFQRISASNPGSKCIEFLSLQDLKGSIYFGGKCDKLKNIKDEKWDLLIIDEAHEGVDTYKTDVAFDHISRRWTLHLSGTPFKAIANDKFPEDAIFNWTYADEQKAKRDWDESSEQENPYADLPKLSMFTYQMSEIVQGVVEGGIDIDGETAEYAFDLNEFFATNKSGTFVHEESVDKFLDALTTMEKYPFSTPELRDQLKHTFWLLNRVDSAKALARKLKVHPVFKDYEVVLAAGDGKLDEAEETEKSLDKVRKAIKGNERTITLSVGQLTTGITIPEWSAVLMLSNIGSPSLYMQAAFRAQNPCMYSEGTDFYRKENCYVFDFDPARTLDIYEKFANDLSTETVNGKGDMGARKARVGELLNFFPVLGEDSEGRMIELDAEKVLSIPRRIRSIEVVRRGFMSDFLFQNISNVFHAPPAVWEILKKIEPAKDQGDLNPATRKDLNLNENGDVDIPKKVVVGTATEMFGDKIYEMNLDNIDELFRGAEETKTPSENDKKIEQMTEYFHTKVTAPIIEIAKYKYGRDLTSVAEKELKRKIDQSAQFSFKKGFDDLQIKCRVLDTEKANELSGVTDEEKIRAVEKKYEAKKAEAAEESKVNMVDRWNESMKSATEDVVERVMVDQQNQKKRAVEEGIRDHLRGFSRTIPSFLMAYGGEQEVTLENFDSIIPADVFKEVTSISIDDFRFLRDGGPYVNDETGKEEMFGGHLFDPVVFNDSVKEFFAMRERLANYFDESAKEDIFDYIPPQKTNQIFTPKSVVKDMVDRLEKENPGCFDDPEKTFADLYMKSGLYLAEIVKRLYSSKRMKELFPDEKERLNHIFAKQVYGLAPTEIIYRIARSFVLGFSDEIKIDRDNLIQLDALPLAKDGKLDAELRKRFKSP